MVDSVRRIEEERELSAMVRKCWKMNVKCLERFGKRGEAANWASDQTKFTSATSLQSFSMWRPLILALKDSCRTECNTCKPYRHTLEPGTEDWEAFSDSSSGWLPKAISVSKH